MAEQGAGVTGAEALHDLDAVFDHVAVAAPKIRDLLPIYADILGGRIVHGGDNERVGYRAMQLGFADGSRIELMEPLAGSTFFDSFFARTGGGGLHHVTFKVGDIDLAVRALRGRGFRTIGLHTEDPSWREVFLHPKEAHGTLVQLAQPGTLPDLSGLTLEALLAGYGHRGNGLPSP